MHFFTVSNIISTITYCCCGSLQLLLLIRYVFSSLLTPCTFQWMYNELSPNSIQFEFIFHIIAQKKGKKPPQSRQRGTGCGGGGGGGERRRGRKRVREMYLKLLFTEIYNVKLTGKCSTMIKEHRSEYGQNGIRASNLWIIRSLVRIPT